ARHPGSRVKMAVVPSGGRGAITNYEAQLTYGLRGAGNAGPQQRRDADLMVSLLRCSLETGRTHQVPVHLAHISTPIIGGRLYAAGFRTKIHAAPEPIGGALELMNRQALHAAVLRFRHPTKRKLCSFESALPEDIAHLCNAVERLGTKLSNN